MADHAYGARDRPIAFAPAAERSPDVGHLAADTSENLRYRNSAPYLRRRQSLWDYAASRSPFT